MPDIKDSVGQGETNNLHDVALVQVMLRVIKDAKGAAYLGGNYDGKFAPNTKDAIIRFQQDQKLIAPPAPKAGPGGAPRSRPRRPPLGRQRQPPPPKRPVSSRRIATL